MLFHIWEYCKYFFLREGVYSLQSPFVYQLYKGLLLYRKTNKTGDTELEKTRKAFINSRKHVEIEDMGAGSRFASTGRRKLSSLVRNSTSPLKYSLLYQFLCKNTPANTVLELGTSVGLNTGYMAAATKGNLFTFEGSSKLMKLAKSHLNKNSTIHFIEGDITETLPLHLKKGIPVDFVLLDANHTYDATLLYCQWIWPHLHEGSILVIGDIHWSSGMKKAWEKIINLPGVTLCLDFFECGVVFFNPSLRHEKYILYY